MKLYLPISSKNFSVIFETESVSPKVFYAQRTFGNTRFRPSPLDLSEEFLTLFSEPVMFEFQERETYPMWLEFDRESLSNNFTNLTDVNKYNDGILSDTVFLYPQTIYFDNSSFRCIFCDIKHLQYTKIDSESYRNVKTTLKYDIAVEETIFFKKMSQLPKIQVGQNSLISSELEKDRRFNHLKGFLYGYAIGELNESSPENKQLGTLFTELQSTFTNAKSQLIMNNSQSDKNYGNYGKGYGNKDNSYKANFDYKPPVYNPTNSKNEILALISKTEKVFFDIFPESKKNETDLAIEKASEIFKILQQENSEQVLLASCQSFINGLQIRNKPFELLKNSVKDFFKLATSKAGLGADETEVSERRFKSNLIKLQKQAERNFLNSDKQPNSLDLTEFEYKGSFIISIDNSKMKLSDPNECILLEIIVAHLLKNPRPQKQGEITRDEKADIIKEIAKVATEKGLSKKENPTQYTSGFKMLYDHFKNLSDLRYDGIESNILKNFACFISKIDRFEELIEFTETKGVRNKKIAYAFWCAYNGFSEISDKNAKIIFASRNLPLINSFNNYLDNVLHILDRETFDFEVTETPKVAHKQENTGLWGKAKEFIGQAFSSTPNSSTLTETKENEQDIKNEKLVTVETYLQMLRKKIWQLPTVSKMNDTQKDDVTKGLAQTTEKILTDMKKGAETYTNDKYIRNALKKSIADVNKSRRKVEYKISEEQLNKIVQEIETLQPTNK